MLTRLPRVQKAKRSKKGQIFILELFSSCKRTSHDCVLQPPSDLFHGMNEVWTQEISLAENIFPMPDFDCIYDQILVLNRIQDAVAALSKAVFILSR
jgi:hypothetical protein